MIQDLRFALRMIATHRWYSAAVIVTLALGIGINTTVFTLVNAVMFKPVPVPGGDRIVSVANRSVSNPSDRSGISYPDYLEYRTQNRTFEGLEAWAQSQGIISDPGLPTERYDLGRVSTGLFTMLRTPPVLGRGFAPSDGVAGASPVVLIGYEIWQKRYEGRPDVIGQSIRLNEKPTTIVGVMPAGFHFPSNDEMWMPIVPDAEWEKQDNRPLQPYGILKPATSVAEAQADLAVISSRLAQAFPDSHKDQTVLVRTFHDTFNGDQIRAVFLAMLGAVGFVLLIACANVANMMMSRAVTRAREISVRAALGASRWQLVRQLLVESVLLSSVGGLVGLALSQIGIHAFDLATRNVGKPYWVLFTMDYVAFAYFGAISILSGIVFGLVPALRASRVDLNEALKDGAPSGGSHRGGRLTAVLVVFQFALTVVLLACAGMMMRSFFASLSVNSFVQPETLFTARIQLPERKGETYAEPAKRAELFEQLVPRLAALPGVTHAAAASFLPGLGASLKELELRDRPNADPKQPPKAQIVVQTPGYLAAIGLPILQGRDFDERDGREHHEAAVVTRAFANFYWPGENAVGKQFRFVDGGKPAAWTTVIGVCGDILQNSRPGLPPLLFITQRQEPWGWMALLLRTRGDPATLASAVRAAVGEIDRGLPVFDAQTLPAAIEHERWFLRTFGALFLTFALIGLLMASVGIYAVVAQATSRRTREIGIRMALGATARRIVGMVLARGLWQLGIGVTLGLMAAFGATQLMATIGLLHFISARDPAVFAVTTVLLIAIGLIACWLPARRAARIAPVEALRTE